LGLFLQVDGASPAASVYEQTLDLIEAAED
jgi:hypothetical protein